MRTRYGLVGTSLVALAAGLAGAFGASACGGPGAQAPLHTAPPSLSSPVATDIAPIAASPAADDTSEVAAPKGLVLVARASKPNDLLAVGSAWSQLPLPGGDFFAEELVGQGVGDILDLDQPADFAMGAKGKGLGTRRLMAVSAAVKSEGQARAAFAQFRLTELGDGSVRIRPPTQKGGGDPDFEDRHVCELGPAYGAASTRLVCAEDDASLDAFSAYLRRTAPRATYASDVHVDVRMAGVRDMFGGQRSLALAGLKLALGEDSGTGALGELSQNLVDFAFDADTIGVDFQLTAQSADATATVHFTGSRSIFTHLATAHPERTDVPPAEFWQLPVDADSAFFHRGLDDSDFAVPKDALLQAIASHLESNGLDEDGRTAVATAFGALLTPAPLVYASGFDVAALPVKLARVEALQPTGGAALADAQQAAGEALLGWRILGVDEAPAKLTSASLRLVTTVTGAYKSAGIPAPKFRSLPAPAGLPAGTTHLELDFYPAWSRYGYYYAPPPSSSIQSYPTLPPPPPSRPVRIHALFVPDGTRTWMVFGADVAVLVKKAHVVLPGGSSADRLGARSDLDVVRAGHAGSGGFFSVTSGLDFIAQTRLVFDGDLGSMAKVLQSSATIGPTPIPFLFTAQPDGSFTAALHVPSAAIDAGRVALMSP